MIKIALVDDHILLRDALAGALTKNGDYTVTLLAAEGSELFEKLRPNDLPDLILLDLNMPGMDGYETAKLLRQKYPNIFVLVLTMSNSELAMIRLLQLGVRGFLKKDISPIDLGKAIETTIETGYFYPSGKLVALLNKGDFRVPTLTENEICFLQLAMTEMTYKEIALKMKISPRTVDNYRDALFEKLDVKSRVGLVLYAINNDLLKTSQ